VKSSCNQEEKQKTQFTCVGYHLAWWSEKQKEQSTENKKKSQSKKITGETKREKQQINNI